MLLFEPTSVGPAYFTLVKHLITRPEPLTALSITSKIVKQKDILVHKQANTQNTAKVPCTKH